MKGRQTRIWLEVFLAVAVAGAALAAPPVVHTVPWSPGNPLIPHDSISGRQITVKGTCIPQTGNTHQYTWDFGDGSAVATGTVSDRYAIEAKHTYTGAAGTIYTARLTVQDMGTGETGSDAYFVILQDVSTRENKLKTDVNIAIDEGLWYLHKSMNRFDDAGLACGDWTTSRYGGYAYNTYISCSAANVNAFEVNGHLETGGADNPYAETVRRGLRGLFRYLATYTVPQQTNPDCGTFTPDGNNNGYYIELTQSYDWYQMGMLMDAIVASGTPGAITDIGELPSGADPGVRGRRYDDVVQDMADGYMWAQYDGSGGGGWRYSANEFPDNSACQWAAIGLIAAERRWGIKVYDCVKTWNVKWLAYTQAADGRFGYDRPAYYPWGALATTPSGMVQMVMDGIGRGESGPTGMPKWDTSESYIRDIFTNTSGDPTRNIKDYYYGLFSFVKSMLLHDPDDDGIENPIQWLHSNTPGNEVDIDWYAAEAAYGDPTDGVARTLIAGQAPTTATAGGGWWYGHQYEGTQQYFETAWAIQMLHATLFDPGAPVAVAKAVPNPGVAHQTILVDGSDSFHQSPGRAIVRWEWDLEGDGTYDVEGPVIALAFDAVGTYPITLRITDDAAPPKQDTDIVNVRITSPPIAPTADPDGPYVFCPAAKPWFLDGRRSVNPDEDEHQTGPYPGDTIREYAWDLDGDNDFNDAFGEVVDVTSFFDVMAPGGHLVQLRVTDTTSASFPDSGLGDLSHTASAQVVVKTSDDPQCECAALSVDYVFEDSVGLSWTSYPGAASYNIYRSSIAGGPYLWIASSAGAAYEDSGNNLSGGKWYYVVRPAALNGDEYCQSNEMWAEPQCSPPGIIAALARNVGGASRLYWKLTATSECYGRAQRGIYLEDTGSTLVLGPLPIDVVIRIARAPAAWAAFSRDYSATYPLGTGFQYGVWLKGQAKVYAMDPEDQVSTPVYITPQ